MDVTGRCATDCVCDCAVHDDVGILDLLSRVLPQGYTALSLDDMRGIIEPCQEIISDQQVT